MDDSQVMRSMVRDDAYRVVRVLAEGPSGRTELVTLGESELLVRKRIPLALANATAWATLMGIHEPRLPHIEEIYQMPDELVVVYSYVLGRSVRELVTEQGAFGAQQAVELVTQVCEAVSALHAKGLVHRDITPGNVIVAYDGAHLVDLGIARQQRAESQHDTSVLGTWGFAAPEQFGFAQTDQRSDVYSIGRLLGFVLTGIDPGTDEYEQALSSQEQVVPALVRVSRRASAFEPSARYQSVDELAKAVSSALGGVGVERDVPTAGVHVTHLSDGASTTTSTRPFARPAESLGAYGSTAGVATPSGYKSPQAMYGPRSFGDAPLFARIVAILSWGFLVVWALLVVATAFSAVTTGDPPWHAAQYGMCVVMFVATGVLGLEIYEAVTLRGHYEYEGSVIRRLGKEVCKILGITFAMMLLCAVLPSS